MSADQTRFQQSSKERFAHAGRFLLLAVQALHAASRANKKGFKKTDDLQLIANHLVFCVYMTIAEKRLTANLTESLTC